MNGLQLKNYMEKLRDDFGKYDDAIGVLTEAAGKLISVSGFAAISEDYKEAVGIYRDLRSKCKDMVGYSTLPQIY